MTWRKGRADIETSPNEYRDQAMVERSEQLAGWRSTTRTYRKCAHQ